MYVGISFEYRANANKAKGAPIDLVFPKEGLGWDLESFAIHKGTKQLDAAKKLANWASSKDAMKLYGKKLCHHRSPRRGRSIGLTCPKTMSHVWSNWTLNTLLSPTRAYLGRMEHSLQRQI